MVFLNKRWMRKQPRCPGHGWPRCWPSTDCALRAASWRSRNAGIPRRRWTICWKSKKARSTDTRLYRCLDRILPHKSKLEQHLKQRYGELFGAEFDVLLYDLTSTYVEGAAEKNPMMSRGYSRDHRPDCEQMVIALIGTGKDFPSAMRPSMATEPTCRRWRASCAWWSGSTGRHGGSG